jgi:predicted DNA-binding antitoxin AbrB/MazE fold protein
MTQVEAIFQEGMFKPLGPVELADNQRVRLSIQPIGDARIIAADRAREPTSR